MKREQTARWLWRLLAISVFCGLPLLLLGLSVSNLMDASLALERVETTRAMTTRIVAQLEKHRSKVTTPVDTARFYLASGTDTLARAEIQDRAGRLTTQAGGRIIETQLNGTPEQEAAGTVAIQLSLEIDNQGLLNLLYAVESGLPLLDVTNLNVQANNDRSGRGDRALHVDMIVRGHWRKTTG